MATPYIPGAAIPRPLLAAAAVRTVQPPPTFITPIVFPDFRVETFDFTAPVYDDDALEAVDDDTVGRDTDFLETMISEGSTSGTVGMHGRKVVIPVVDMMRAQQAQRASGGGNQEVYNLKSRATNLMFARNLRHNEVLGIGQLIKTANYPGSHVFETLDVVNSTLVRETIAEASHTVADDGNGLPANTVVIGDGAWRGLERNTAFMNLLPDTARKILTQEDIMAFMALPEGSRVIRSSVRVRAKKGGDPYYLFSNYIWVGHVGPVGDGVNATFGRNNWMPCDTGERYLVNEIVRGIQRTSELGLLNFYIPTVIGGKYGALIPTESPEDES